MCKIKDVIYIYYDIILCKIENKNQKMRNTSPNKDEKILPRNQISAQQKCQFLIGARIFFGVKIIFLI